MENAEAQNRRIRAIVCKQYGGTAEKVNVLADRNCKSYYLAHNFTLNGKEFKPITLKEKKNEEFDGSLTLDYVVEFYASTEWNDDETPIVRDLLMAEKKLLNEAARMIRGSGENASKVFVDYLMLTFEPDQIHLKKIAPEGVPIICGLLFDIETFGRKVDVYPKLGKRLQFTVELIKFEGCPWPIKMKNQLQTEPDYSEIPSFAGTKSEQSCTAKYMTAIPEHKDYCAEHGLTEQVLYDVKKGIWIHLWANSPTNAAEIGKTDLFSFTEGFEYKVKYVEDWVKDGIYYETSTKKAKSKSKYSEEETEYAERMNRVVKPQFRNSKSFF